jgi:hypothetical protein
MKRFTRFSFPGDFGPFGVGNEPSIGWNLADNPRNLSRILGLIFMSLQTPKFGSEFQNFYFQAQFRTSKQGVRLIPADSSHIFFIPK